MIFQHARFQIWNQNQHPFRHNLSEMLYNNASLPGVTNVQSALDYISAVLYPQSKPAVATPAALPSSGNTINDFRVVTDDGDGKAAGYRWEQREGEVAASWHKIYDLDWGTDSILQGFLTKTQDIYVKQWGYDDLDPSGTPVAGLLAGQKIYGGASANTSLSLFANSGDGVGAGTGYVQVGDNFRPTANATYSHGTTSERWLKGWYVEGQFGTLNIVGGTISDSSGAISFSNENLSTTGTMTVGTTLISGATITNSTGTISFDNENLTTTGTGTFNSVTATGAASTFASGTQIGDLTFTNGNIASASPGLDFDALNLTTTGDITGDFVTGTTVKGGNLILNNNRLSSANTNGNIEITPDGTGIVDIQKAMSTLGITTTGTLSVTGQLNADNLRLDGNTLSSVSGTIDFAPTTDLTTTGLFRATTDNSLDLGTTSQRWRTLWLATSLRDATSTFTVTDLMTLRSAPFRDSARTQAAQAGDALFFDGTQWLASAPDTEVNHPDISGLTTGDSGHTQFVMLAGRVGGQSIQGGTAASNNLDLESTSNATKGFIQTKDTFRAFTDATFSGGWQGADLGGASNRFRHLYTTGEAFGFRAENVGALPSASTQNVGRLVYLTSGDTGVYVDIGTAFERIGNNKYLSDTVWNGTDTSKTVTVSGSVVDARTCIWQLCDNTNDYDRIYCSIKPISATQVTIVVGSALPAGSYRLIGIE